MSFQFAADNDPELRFDVLTGEVRGDVEGCRACAVKDRRIQALTLDLQLSEDRTRREARARAAAQAELSRIQEEAPEGHLARAIFKYWIKRADKNPKRTKFGDKRRKVVLARLREGYDASYICRAIDGACSSEWHLAHGQTDLELICRDEPHLERFHEIAEQLHAATLLGPLWLELFEKHK